MQPSNSHPPHRSLRHFPRLAPSGGLGHSTLIIIIAVSASVLGLLSIFIWRFLARSLRPKSAPLPPRQSLVHQRELQLVAFAEYKDAIVPQVLADGSYIRETDEGTLDSSRGIQLHPPSPQFMPSHTPPNGSYSSLPSSNDDCSPSSGAATPTTRFSMSTSPTQSIRPAVNRSGLPPRPLSVVSTNSRVSRQSIRGAPHAPHNNVQIMLPAPLAPCLYKETASDGPLLLGTWTRNSTYSVRDNWRRSLADSWVPVGQDCLSDSEPMERQHGRDSIERPTRLIRRGSSPGLLLLRSGSNPSSLSRFSPSPSSGLHQLPEDTHPPVPRIPSEFETLSALAPSGSLTPSPSPSSTDSHKPRS